MGLRRAFEGSPKGFAKGLPKAFRKGLGEGKAYALTEGIGEGKLFAKRLAKASQLGHNVPAAETATHPRSRLRYFDNSRLFSDHCFDGQKL